MTNTANIPRRQFLQATVSAIAAVTVLGAIPLHAAPAATLPHLNPDGPAAKILGYAADTNQVKSSDFPNHTPDQKCKNCAFYSGHPEAKWGKCQLFPVNTVAAQGWCSEHTMAGA